MKRALFAVHLGAMLAAWAVAVAIVGLTTRQWFPWEGEMPAEDRS